MSGTTRVVTFTMQGHAVDIGAELIGKAGFAPIVMAVAEHLRREGSALDVQAFAYGLLSALLAEVCGAYLTAEQATTILRDLLQAHEAMPAEVRASFGYRLREPAP